MGGGERRPNRPPPRQVQHLFINVYQVLRAGEGLQTVDDTELKKLVQEEQYVLALFCKSSSIFVVPLINYVADHFDAVLRSCIYFLKRS